MDDDNCLSFSLRALAVPSTSFAQAQRRKVPQLSETLSGQSGRVAALHAGLLDLGCAGGKTISIETRPDGDYERLPALAAELAALKVALIVAFDGAPAAG